MSVLDAERRPQHSLPLDDPIYRPKTIATKLDMNYYHVLHLLNSGAFGERVQLGGRAVGARASGVAEYLERMKAKAAEKRAKAKTAASEAPAGSEAA
jgi:predicted DNA-binding transcriptional regulator AlpA